MGRFMEISKHQACYVKHIFYAAGRENCASTTWNRVYMYIHVYVLHSVSIYEAECSCHFLPLHSGKMIQWGALTMVAIITVHIRVQMYNIVLNTGYYSICWKQQVPLKLFTQLCLTLCEVLVIVLEDGFTYCWLPFFLYEFYVNVVLLESFGENDKFPSSRV
jgi:hypothetical protein